MVFTTHQKDIKSLLEKMTLTEKVALLSGRNAWFTVPIERLGIPSIAMTDGPHGVRTGGHGQGRIVGSATAYPTGVSMASTWNTALIERVGEALGEENALFRLPYPLGTLCEYCAFTVGWSQF